MNFSTPSFALTTLRRSCLPGVLILLLGGGLAGRAFGQAAPLLTPMPRELHAGALASVRSATVTVPGGDAEDLFAANDLAKALTERGVTMEPVPHAPEVTITLLRAASGEAKQLLAEEHLGFDRAMHDEGYVLVAKAHEVTIVGETAAGVFYGAQTLKQMVVPGTGPKLWTGTIRDCPAMKYRGIDDDMSRGPFPTLAFQEHQLQVFAEHKINLYSPYFEHTLAYANDPLAAPPDSSLSPAEAHELVAFASRLHIAIVPEQEAFGHLHHVLQYEKYSDLAETPHGHVLAPGQSGSFPLIKSWFTQIAEDFPSPFLHIGADETFELGTGRTKADVDKRGLGAVYAEFLANIHTTLAPLNRRLLFWGDVAWSDASTIKGLPKDMIAIPWVYWHEDNYDPNILPFKNAGMETWVAPGDSNWNVIYPVAANALDNISGFVESGQRLGSTGVLNTVWNDDGEGLFNEDWFGVLFGAAAGWQPGKSDAAAYQAAFGETFFGDTSGRIDAAQKEIMAAEKIDVSDTTFWMDPWSPQATTKAARLRAQAGPSRLHAERAIELIEQVLADEPNVRERPALKAMELGARRIDFLGLKFQLADEMAQAYAKAYAMRADTKHETETRELLYSISSMNGRCQDLRDGYSMLKNLYREVWLSENRPYWLDNVLVRYDLRIQLWQQRGEEFEALREAWSDTKELPTAAEVGIP